MRYLIRPIEGQKDKMTKGQKDKRTKGQNDKRTEISKYRKTERQKDKKTKRQRPKREFIIATSGQFCTLAMFLLFVANPVVSSGVLVGEKSGKALVI